MDLPAVQITGGGDDGIAKVRGLLHSFQPGFVGLRIDKMKRISGSKLSVELLELSIVEEQRQACARVDAVMVVALRADLQVVLESLAPDDLTAMFAFQPKAFRAHAAASFLGSQRGFVASEPSHGNTSLTQVCSEPRPLQRSVIQVGAVLERNASTVLILFD